MPAGQGEGGVHTAQLVPVQCAESTEKLFALIGQDHPDGASVVRVGRPIDEPLGLGSVDQFDDAVMAQLEPVGEFAHHGPVASGEALERQHELVLLGRDAVTAHRLLAEAKIATDPEAKPGKGFKVLLAQGVPCRERVVRGTPVPRSRFAVRPCHTRTLSCYDISIKAHQGAGLEAAFRRWVVLSDHEQRALEELERSYATEASEPVRSGPATRLSPRRSNRPPGFRVVLLLACVSVALVFASVPEAALALALATAIGWLFWRLWAHRTDDGSLPAPLVMGADHGHDGSDRRPGESIRQYLKWLAEAE
jgi:hypothetical protein